MKNKIILTSILVLATIICMAQKRPEWTYYRNIPEPTNDTYRYIVECGSGASERDARNDAFGRVFQSIALSHRGVSFDIQEINRALQNGTDYTVISSQYTIPINKVCEYSEKVDGGYWRVYLLCQVAKGATTYVNFDDYNDCYSGDNNYYAKEALYAKGQAIYRNGNKLNEGDIRTLFANSKSYDLYDKGCRMIDKSGGFMGAGGGVVIASGFLWLAGIFGDIDNFNNNSMWITAACIDGVGVGLFITGAVLPSIGKSKIRKAVNLYNNNKMYSHNSIQMDYGFTGNGVYLTMTF